jgi:hypothetical protein
MSGFLTLTMVALVLAACTEQDVKTTGSIAARSLCHSARNCTVQDEGSP